MIGLLLESDALGWYILLMICLIFGLPILLLIIGIAIRSKNKKVSNIILITVATYAIIGLGICGALMI